MDIELVRFAKKLTEAIFMFERRCTAFWARVFAWRKRPAARPYSQWTATYFCRKTSRESMYPSGPKYINNSRIQHQVGLCSLLKSQTLLNIVLGGQTPDYIRNFLFLVVVPRLGYGFRVLGGLRCNSLQVTSRQPPVCTAARRKKNSRLSKLRIDLLNDDEEFEI